MAAPSSRTDPYAAVSSDAPDPYAGLGAADPYADYAAPEPAQSYAGDKVRRVARSAVEGVGQVVAYGGRTADASKGIFDRVNRLTAEFFGINPPGYWDHQEAPENRAGQSVVKAGEAIKELGRTYVPDPTRDKELGARAAEIVGGLAPAVAALPAGIPAVVATVAGQTGEAQRDSSLATGDSVELADAKGKLAAAGGALMGVVPAGPVRAGAQVAERLASRAVTGGVLNATQDAAMQQAVEGEVDWGRVRESGAIGTGLGLVLGVPEAIAVRRTLGGSAPLEGKTLGEALEQVSAESGAPVEALRERVNIAARVKTKVQQMIAPQSLLPDPVRDAMRFGEQATAAVKEQGLSLTKDLEAAIKAVPDEVARTAASASVQQYLTGQLPVDALPAELRVQASRVRNYVDELSDRAVASGAVSGEMAQTFLDNKGSYLRRSYDIFLDPDYTPAPEKVQAAIKAVQEADGLAAADAEAVVAGILDKNTRAALPDFLLGRGKLAGKDVSSLVRRQDLLPEIRDLLGEVKDPLLAANQTIPRMARLVEMDAAQKRVREIGLRLGVFSEQQSLERPSPIVSDASRTHDRLTGLYAAPEIADALQREASSGRVALVPDAIWKGLTSASTLAKTAKTVGNPESYAPNFVGGVVSMLSNGNFRFDAMKRGLMLGAEELGALRKMTPGAPGREALRTELADLRRLGLLGESTSGQDLLRTVEQSYWNQLGDKSVSVIKFPAKIYGGIDDLTRYAAYRSELARYSAVFPGMPEAELRRHAAEVTRATMPTYSAVPQVVKQLSTAGVAPPFINFTWEVFRNTLNTARVGIRDLRTGQATGNAAQMRAGAARLTALTASLGAASVWGLSKLSRDEHGVTDDQDAALRYFSPPWNKDGTLQYHGPASAGQPVSFSNLSYLLPQAVVWQALDAARRGLDENQAGGEFVRALGEQFGTNPVKDSVVLTPAVGALTGLEPQTGRPIPRSAVDPTVLDRAKYFAKEAFMPLAVDWVRKMRKAQSGEQGDYGRVYSVDEQLRRLVAVRQQTLDPVKAVSWKARKQGEELNQAADIYHLQRRRQAVPAMMDVAYQAAERERQRVFTDMQAAMKHARALGVGDDQVIEAYRTARLPAKVILGALDGRYVPLDREERVTPAQIAEGLQEKKADERRAALVELYRNDPALAGRVIGSIKEAAKNLTPRDKLIQSLAPADRAAYLRRQLEAQPSSEARRSWLLDLRRKGVLTDSVFQAMASPPSR